MRDNGDNKLLPGSRKRFLNPHSPFQPIKSFSYYCYYSFTTGKLSILYFLLKEWYCIFYCCSVHRRRIILCISLFPFISSIYFLFCSRFKIFHFSDYAFWDWISYFILNLVWKNLDPKGLIRKIISIITNNTLLRAGTTALKKIPRIEEKQTMVIPSSWPTMIKLTLPRKSSI